MGVAGCELRVGGWGLGGGGWGWRVSGLGSALEGQLRGKWPSDRKPLKPPTARLRGLGLQAQAFGFRILASQTAATTAVSSLSPKVVCVRNRCCRASVAHTVRAKVEDGVADVFLGDPKTAEDPPGSSRPWAAGKPPSRTPTSPHLSFLPFSPPSPPVPTLFQLPISVPGAGPPTSPACTVMRRPSSSQSNTPPPRMVEASRSKPPRPHSAWGVLRLGFLRAWSHGKEVALPKPGPWLGQRPWHGPQDCLPLPWPKVASAAEAPSRETTQPYKKNKNKKQKTRWDLQELCPRIDL